FRKLVIGIREQMLRFPPERWIERIFPHAISVPVLAGQQSYVKPVPNVRRIRIVDGSGCFGMARGSCEFPKRKQHDNEQDRRGNQAHGRLQARGMRTLASTRCRRKVALASQESGSTAGGPPRQKQRREFYPIVLLHPPHASRRP